MVEFGGDSIQLVLFEAVQVRVPGQVAADQAIGVLDRAFLLGMIGVAEVERDGYGLGDHEVIGILATIVCRSTRVRKMSEAGNQGMVSIPGQLAAQAGDDRETAEPIDQDIQRLSVAEEQRIALPVADFSPR